MKTTEDVNKENDLLVMFPASRRFNTEVEETVENDTETLNFDEMFPASKNFPVEDDLISDMIGEEDLEYFSAADADFYEEKISQIYSNEQLLDRLSVNVKKLNEMTNKMKYYMDEIDIFLVK